MWIKKKFIAKSVSFSDDYSVVICGTVAVECLPQFVCGALNLCFIWENEKCVEIASADFFSLWLIFLSINTPRRLLNLHLLWPYMSMKIIHLLSSSQYQTPRTIDVFSVEEPCWCPGGGARG